MIESLLELILLSFSHVFSLRTPVSPVVSVSVSVWKRSFAVQRAALSNRGVLFSHAHSRRCIRGHFSGPKPSYPTVSLVIFVEKI